MWSAIKNNLPWVMIASHIVTAILSFTIARKILRRQLKTEFWREKLKNIDSLLDRALDSFYNCEPIFMTQREYGYTDDLSFKMKVENLAISDKKLKKLLLKYDELIVNYNNAYFNLPVLDPYEKNKDPGDIKNLVEENKSDFVNLHKRIKIRIEKICT